MARINLLPWREELRQQKKKNFITAVGVSVVVTVILFGLAHRAIEGMITYQEARNKIMEDENAKLDIKLGEIKDIETTKNKLLAKIDLIQKLQSSRPEIVHLFDELPRITPDGVYLTSFAQKGVELTFTGISQSNARVSAFMRAIDASKWLQKSALDNITSTSKEGAGDSIFKLIAKQGQPVTETPK